MAIIDLIGSSPKFRALLAEVEKVAPVDSAVLIQGETGTGKEVIARGIHEASPRRNHRFVALNCAAIPSALLESELFGHERGAFTGACTQTRGRFQIADGGTLFLDEIGDMPLELQPKLLRALQEREFERLGSNQTVRVNVRVIAATNQDLGQMVRERRFRADLLQIKCVSDDASALAGTAGRYRATDRILCQEVCWTAGQSSRNDSAGCDGSSRTLRLAW